MQERDNYIFMDTSSLKRTEGISERANEAYIRHELQKLFPEEIFPVLKITLYKDGCYGKKPNIAERIWGSRTLIDNLPEFYEIEMTHSTGQHEEEITVWTPVAWNDRFAGTAGGGTATGGKSYLTYPDNTQRGWTVPLAVVNGFSAATVNANNQKGLKDLTVRDDGSVDREIYDNWLHRSTHDMTVFGKAVTEIIHGRKVRYSYMNGGSGGGRQSLTEVQRYPDDYDGVWAVCPAINWHQFLLGGFWPLVVMKKYNNFISAEKNDFFIREVHKAYGGDAEYYKYEGRIEFDARKLIGKSFGKGIITETDAEVMNEIWKGPHTEKGDFLWYGYYAGSKNWNVNIPIGAYYYPLFNNKKIKPFILADYYARWILEDRRFSYKEIDQEMLEKLYDIGAQKFSDCFSNDPEIDAFVRHGGKLIMDHGMDDPLIPTEGTIDYYKKLENHFGKEKLNDFCRMYITPGDSHGNCWGNGPGLTVSDGMKALIDWVEKGIAPEKIRKVRVDRKTHETLEEGYQKPYESE
ncbi:MAG: tannase/feruloyl esterase family alpha/beta hydrolase [Erysipelotrichaceae bacterium]|nr:tannase/feruloyl esterase family alpha/beta hydrolase [Erysipelotrichaceae bacterium]MBQ4457325.1 tannase/feruloyl esterase family alpha/beta hydrolase [Clostridia bacterium]